MLPNPFGVMHQCHASIRRSSITLLTFFLFFLMGCQQQMAEQPKYLPLQPSLFFSDGQSARPLVAGTVARGQLHDDSHFYSGRRNLEQQEAIKAAAMVGAAKPSAMLGQSMSKAEYFDSFPFPITMKELERGQQRFGIFCAVCHDALGTGNGIVVQRGFTRPPSFHEDLSRGFKLRGIDMKLPEAPVGYYFEVISQGYGAMPDYASQVPPRDRWDIIAYIRALQLSQKVKLADLPAPERQEIETEINRGRGQ